MNDARNAPAPALVVTAGPESGTRFAVDHDGELTVGRSPDSDVRLSDPSVSRRHAVIRREGDRISIQDVGSRSGTKINGADVTGAVALAGGDVIALGGTTLHFQQGVPVEAGHDASTRKTIFMCYRREDAGGYARALYDELSDHYGEGSVFRDLDALAPGEDYEARIEDAISSCNVAVILIGKIWATATDAEGKRRLDDPNDLLVQEIAAALKPGRKVLPVLVEGAQMPDDSAFPPAIEDLKRLNALEISDSRWRADVDRLFDAIGSAHVASPMPLPAERSPNSAAKPVAIVVALVAILVIAGFAVFKIVQSNDGGGSAQPNLASDVNDQPILGGGPTGDAQLTLEPASGAVGSEGTATATGFRRGEHVEIDFSAIQVVEGDADGQGRVELQFTVPQFFSGFRAGTPIAVSATGSRTLRSDTATFTLTG